jgi:hypothetical protein
MKTKQGSHFLTESSNDYTLKGSWSIINDDRAMGKILQVSRYFNAKFIQQIHIAVRLLQANIYATFTLNANLIRIP